MNGYASIEHFVDERGDMEINHLEPLRESGTEYVLVASNGEVFRWHHDDLARYLQRGVEMYDNQNRRVIPGPIDRLDDLADWLLKAGFDVSVEEPSLYGGPRVTARVFVLDGFADSFHPSYRHFHYRDKAYKYSPDGYYPELAGVLTLGTDLREVLDNHCDSLQCLY